MINIDWVIILLTLYLLNWGFEQKEWKRKKEKDNKKKILRKKRKIKRKKRGKKVRNKKRGKRKEKTIKRRKKKNWERKKKKRENSCYLLKEFIKRLMAYINIVMIKAVLTVLGLFLHCYVVFKWCTEFLIVNNISILLL